MKSNKKRLEFIKQVPKEYTSPKIHFIINGQNNIVLEAPAYFGEKEKLWLIKPDMGGIVIGGDGFGYEYDQENDCLVKFPHHGGVKIGKDVEIGFNTCIDRATLEGEFTEIGDGTKIDNLVHIAHNVKIGRNCLIVAGTVIGGSAVIGDRCFIGIGAMIKNKVKIGNDVTVGMGAVVLHDVPDGVTVIGNPARIL